jgi:3-oxoacyl-[acyl-carrier protein] reductase
MNVNVRAAALLVKALVPHMNRGGRIINVSSILARNPFPGVDIYTASKGALEALTRQWARTLGRSHGITTNAVSPGMILTDMTEGTDPSVLDLSKRSATAGERLGTRMTLRRLWLSWRAMAHGGSMEIVSRFMGESSLDEGVVHGYHL